MTIAPTRRALGTALFALALACALAPSASAQFETRWVAAGDLHNWYSSSGSECEICFVSGEQQYGWRWPGIYRYTDTQAAKGLWLGAQNVTGPQGTAFPVRVVHVGPRVSGVGEVFPTLFELVARNDLTIVTVDGNQSFPAAEMIADRVDPDLPSDVMLQSRVNTLLGVTMDRRVYQFSQQYHDDYHVVEYVFTNTGNADADDEIELNQTIEGFTVFFQNRMAVARESRYVVDNSTGWGKNTMNDTRGDGLPGDPSDEQFRAQFAWHGLSPTSALPYDNLGASVQAPAINISPADTLGRLTASQFVGVVTLHADASATDDSDDPGQPSTTTWLHSDDPLLSNNDAFNGIKMQSEYNVMRRGRPSSRPGSRASWPPPTTPRWGRPAGSRSRTATGRTRWPRARASGSWWPRRPTGSAARPTPPSARPSRPPATTPTPG